MKYWILLLLAFLIFSTGNSQPVIGDGKSTSVWKGVNQDTKGSYLPIYRNDRYPDCSVFPAMTQAERIQEVREFVAWKVKREQERSAARTFPVRYTVPVVVHLIEDVPAITDVDIHKAISSLNNAFSHTHDDPAGADFGRDGCVPCLTKGIDTEIEFCLVQRTPDNGVTSGITRISSEYVRFDKDIENEKLKTMDQWDPKYYLNIWVVSQIYSELGASHTGRKWWSRAAVGGYGTFPALGGVASTESLDGVVVAGLSPTLWAHECGHYLRLYHTFQKTNVPGYDEPQDCINNNCLTDGDQVCDTPPDGTTLSAVGGCNKPDNTCDTDALSYLSGGIIKSENRNSPAYKLNDQPDMISNFMDYGNDGCHTDFSPGQKERMLAALGMPGKYRNAMITQAPSGNDACSKPCGNVFVSFTQNLRYPKPGDAVVFASTATGAAAYGYDWYVEDLGILSSDKTGSSVAWIKGTVPTGRVVAFQNNPVLTFNFATNHKYRVVLRAWDIATPACFASYERIVNVSCGVDARFWPNKRFIASKEAAPPAKPESKFRDTVTFFNRSIGADTYTWTISHTPFTLKNGAPNGTPVPTFTKVLNAAPPTTDHTVFNPAIDLRHIFPQPGWYSITLKASFAGCEDTSLPFMLKVVDPSVDGEALIVGANCLGDDKIRVTLQIRNNSYDTIPIGTPVSFYENDPRNAALNPRLLHTFHLTDTVFGHEPNEWFYNIDILAKPKVNNLFAVFNDEGTTVFPIVFPASEKDIVSSAGAGIYPGAPAPSPPRIYEQDYENNFWQAKDFQFKLNLTPTTATVCAFTNYSMNGTTVNDGGSTVWEWKSPANLSCANCSNPTITLQDSDRSQKVIVTSKFLCHDSTTIKITVPYPAPVIKNPPDLCEGGTPQDLLNSVTTAATPNLKWYDAQTGGVARTTRPVVDSSIPGTHAYWVTQTESGCEGPRTKITYIINPSTVPKPAITTPQDVCAGGIAPDLSKAANGSNLKWYTSAVGGTSAATPPATSTAVDGTFSNYVSQVINGCESPRALVTYTVKYVVDAPLVRSIPDICFNANPPKFTDFVTGTNLLWYAGHTGGNPGPVTPLIDTKTSGMYEQWVSQFVNGCESPRSKIPYTVKPPEPKPTVVKPAPLCVGATDFLLNTLVTGTQLNWYTNETGGIPLASVPGTHSTAVGSYDYWVSQIINGCESPRELVSYQVLGIEIKSENEFTIDEGDTKVIQAQVITKPGQFRYILEWTDESVKVIGNSTEIQVAPVNSTSYSVSAVLDDAKCSAKQTVIANVVNVLYPAEIFSPNADGANDVWVIRNIEKFPDAIVSIYNRWGELLLRTPGYLNNWDGTKGGQVLPAATYYYSIDMSAYQKRTTTGSVTIIK